MLAAHQLIYLRTSKILVLEYQIKLLKRKAVAAESPLGNLQGAPKLGELLAKDKCRHVLVTIKN
ncbi:MAG: hypothetical protein AAF316_14445, partial [Cyanobacteria bacterium P01_A01_bin.80]